MLQYTASNPGRLEPDETVYRSFFPWRPLRADVFRNGCVNPAIVVGHNLIAVYTDLSRSDSGHCPVIKLEAQPLDRLPAGCPPVGTRLATCTSYHGDTRTDRWNTIQPIVVDCATTNSADIERVFASIDDSEWAQLDQCLRQLNEPFEDGVQYVFDSALRPSHVEVHPLHPNAGEVQFSSAPHTVFRGNWLMIFIIMITFMAMGGFFLWDVFVRGSTEYDGNLWWGVPLALSMFGIFFWGVWWLRRERVELYDAGLRWCLGGRWSSALWQDVHDYVFRTRSTADDAADVLVEIGQSFLEKHTHARFSHTITIVELRFCGGRKVSLRSAYTHSWRLFNAIVDKVDAQTLAEARLRLRHGDFASFGHMRLYPNKELRWGDKRIPLSDIVKCRAVDGTLTIQTRDSTKKRYRVANCYALERLLSEGN